MKQQKNCLFLGIVGLILIIGGLFLVALTLDLVPDVAPQLAILVGQWIFALIGVVAVLIGILFFSAGFKVRENVQVIKQYSELGEIKISFAAIEAMVLKASRQIKGIREIKTFINSVEQGLVVYLKVKVMPDLKIPELAAELQEGVKNYVEEISGNSVAEVKVLIENLAIEQQHIKKQ